MYDLRFERRAQTNTQLYGQLIAARYGSEEIVAVHRAYTLATKVFAGQLRPEGRPFVCHVVGVASILAMVEAPHATIVGGLLHSAYSHGDFGHGRGHVTRAARICSAQRPVPWWSNCWIATQETRGTERPSMRCSRAQRHSTPSCDKLP